MRVLTVDGLRVLDVVPGSKDASTIGGHWNAIKVYRDTGDPSLLRQFDVAVGGRLRLQTDPAAVKAWGREGELDMDDPYEPLGGDR